MDRHPTHIRTATLIFVYGTFLDGEDNHPWLDKSEFVGAYRTRAVYDLVDLGGFPAMVPGGVTQVHGEVYAVDRETIIRLDEFEDSPEYYRRTKIELEDGSPAEAYLLSRERACVFPRIESGDWRQR